MNIPELINLIRNLSAELKNQRSLYEHQLRDMKRRMKEQDKRLKELQEENKERPEPRPEEEPAPPTQPELLKKMIARSRRGKEGITPDFRTLVERDELDKLSEMGESVFIALLERDFGTEAAEDYRRRRMPGHVCRRIMHYYDAEADEGRLEISDELRAAAAAAEREREQERHLLKPTAGTFRLRGRAKLERFFNEHVVDIVNHHEVYRAVGVDFPEPFLLEGAPGCGKTYAVERLAEHLGWYIVRITASSVGSTFIHETAKKIEQSFEEAAAHAPSLLVIDEMDAFMPDRSRTDAKNTHTAEEVGSFLKCLQKAAREHVLVVGMTNRREAVDPAILRTGRLGTHIEVGMPSLAEVEDVLRYELEQRPHQDFALTPLAERLLNHPLSDVCYVVKEAAMHTARRRCSCVTEHDLITALERMEARRNKEPEQRPIGFAA